MSILPYRSTDHLPGLCALLNRHIGAIVPGWELTPAFVEKRLRDNPEQPVLNPWVVERHTLCAVEGGTVVAAAHMLRYGQGPAVSADYHDLAEIAWSIHRPEHQAAGVEILRHAREVMRAWGVRERVVAFDLIMIDGVPDRWPHVGAALRDAGFYPDLGDEYSRDTLRQGPIGPVTPDPRPPLPGLRVLSQTGTDTRFAVLQGNREVGYCQSRADLTRDGLLPALASWAEISDLEVQGDLRGHGIGTWLLTHTCSGLAARGCSRVVLCVGDDDESRRAGHLYDRFGWPVTTTYEKLWREKTARQ